MKNKNTLLSEEIDVSSFSNVISALWDNENFFCLNIPQNKTASRYVVVGVAPSETFSMAGAFVTESNHTTIDSPNDAFERFTQKAFSQETDRYAHTGPCVVGFAGFSGAMALSGLNPSSGFSRIPQSYAGLYSTPIVFDKIEGTTRIYFTDQHYRNALQAIDKIYSSASEWHAQATKDTEWRWKNSDAEFDQIVSRANEWVRSEAADSIHLTRTKETSASNKEAIGDFLALLQNNIPSALFHTRNSMLVIEMSQDTAFSSDQYSKGIAEFLLNRSHLGTPALKAKMFFTQVEDNSRGVYGGSIIFGNGSKLSAWHVNRSRIYCDGVVSETCGMDVTNSNAGSKISF